MLAARRQAFGAATPARAVSRASLIENAAPDDSRVVSVVAPAGYGKSFLLAEWARVEDRPVAWVSLDGFDDDPAVLMFLLASAYGRSPRTHAAADR